MTRGPINKSPFYRLESRKTLAEILLVTSEQLEEAAALGIKGYLCFEKKTAKGKIRKIAKPKEPLSSIQKRICRLLEKTEPPSYLKSTYKRTSYVKNALAHCSSFQVAKIDIQNFFPNVRSYYVRKTFLEIFKCSPDVAALLVKLTTLQNRLPTGGRTSPMLAFWAYKPMYDEIDALAMDWQVKMTCYIDDFTFSGNRATKGLLFEVRKIISKYQLRAHKEKIYCRRLPKLITGVIQTIHGTRLPNERRKKLREAWEAYYDPKNRLFQDSLVAQLWGRAVEAAKVERKYEGLRNSLKAILFSPKK